MTLLLLQSGKSGRLQSFLLPRGRHMPITLSLLAAARTRAISLLGLLSLFGSGISSAAHQTNVADAITHAQAAVNDGQRGTADAVAGHAQQALEHANQAINHATMGHPDIAANHAKEAMRHLKLAYQEIAGT